MARSPDRPEFPSTQWSLVERARGLDLFLRREALEALVMQYWPALRAHLVVRRRLSPEAADDMLQGFAADRILQQRFLSQADPGKGRFRSFLLRCLENYRIDHWRGREPVSNLADGIDEPIAAADQPDAFDVAWARQVLKESLRLTFAECCEEGQLTVWSIFEQRVLRPAISDVEAPSYDQLIAELGFESAQQAANALVTAKRRFRRVLEGVVSQYVLDKADVQAEIAELRVILAIADPATTPAHLGDFAAAAGLATADLPAILDESNPSFLARLFGVDDDRDAVWEDCDLKNMLERLLALPLAEGLPGLDHRRIADAARAAGTTPGSLTLADVFTQPKPSVKLLLAIKEWARSSTRAKEPPLPTELASLLYFASIAAAKLRRGQWISKLDPALVRQGIDVLLAHSWINDPFRTLFGAFVASANDRG